MLPSLSDSGSARRTHAQNGIPRLLKGYLAGGHQDRRCIRIRLYPEGRYCRGESNARTDRPSRWRVFWMLAGLRGTGVRSDRRPWQDSSNKPGLPRRSGLQIPAASEDVAAVYKEMRKNHAPESIGIYRCSAGAMMSVAWFQKHNLPRLGAVGIFCAGAGSRTGVGFGGDAAYTAGPLGEARIMVPTPPNSARPNDAPAGLNYLAGTDPKDPLVAPINSPEVLAKFPPTLIITATRGFEMSGAVYTYTQLVKMGADAELHVWDGLFHGFFYNPDVPESRDCYDVIVRFFDRHLSNK